MKMDLLHQILLRLPVPRISEIAPALLPEVVKYLNRGKIPPETVDRYIEAFRKHYPNSPEIALLYFQGLTVPGMDSIVPCRMIMDRAAFLRNTVTYLELAQRYPISRDDMLSSEAVYLNTDLSLLSDVPEIQAAMLAIGQETSMSVQDPEIINWTRGLIQYYSSQPTVSFDVLLASDAVWTLGYIHATLKKYHWIHVEDYLIGYLTREMQTYPDPFVDSPRLNNLVKNWRGSADALDIYMKSGYFPSQLFTERLDRLIRAALEYIQPKFVRRYLSETKRILANSNVYVRVGGQIRYSLIEHAEEMLALLESSSEAEPRSMAEPEYLLSLRILTGRRIDPDLLPRLMIEWPNLVGQILEAGIDPALRLMVSVAHPQIPENLFIQFPDLANIYSRYSSVLYDLVHYFKVSTRTGVWEFNKSKFTRLYTLGRLLDAYSPEKIDSLIEKIGIVSEYALPSAPRKNFAERYQQILRL